jgi:hypothetical protein
MVNTPLDQLGLDFTSEKFLNGESLIGYCFHPTLNFR